jgi:hypothetical protein
MPEKMSINEESRPPFQVGGSEGLGGLISVFLF